MSIPYHTYLYDIGKCDMENTEGVQLTQVSLYSCPYKGI
ncbi:hypothetical protein T11_10933 [Trichinella zimbabwensis]|uniref:Uncharacterized protein n=1 Tax=Trichinella zimbabwensis TaxID=268475 RepID=A0A0V1GLI6_9BILA|nr:hypothetical protein T11_10933 [Trichinella zimbabwensis]